MTNAVMTKLNRKLLDSPVFILGCPRTGTSLVLTLLSDHSNILVYPVELQFFKKKALVFKHNAKTKRDFVIDSFLGALRKFLRKVSFDRLFEIEPRIRDFKALYAREFDGLEKADINLIQRMVFSYFFAMNIIDEHKKIWIEKTPKNEFYINELLKMFPRAKFIHMIRDPRGILPIEKIAF